jgi:hypothetical protein
VGGVSTAEPPAECNASRIVIAGVDGEQALESASKVKWTPDSGPLVKV